MCVSPSPRGRVCAYTCVVDEVVRASGRTDRQAWRERRFPSLVVECSFERRFAAAFCEVFSGVQSLVKPVDSAPRANVWNPRESLGPLVSVRVRARRRKLSAARCDAPAVVYATLECPAPPAGGSSGGLKVARALPGLLGEAILRLAPFPTSVLRGI